jgi:16S rRNA (guanine527-N7)-methyltransferase
MLNRMPVNIDTTGFSQRLLDAASRIGISLSPEQAEQLVHYVELLFRWNSTYNLTAVRDPSEMLDRHIIDSLSVVPFIDAESVMDVGTGPGLPGIPLALLFPNKQFTLVDSNIKKTRFLTQALITLGLKNVEVVHTRIESLIGKRTFPLIISRAFTAADNFAELCGPCLSENGKLLAMKGSEAQNEANALKTGYIYKDIIKLDVPGCEAQRHLIIIEKEA